MKKIPFAAILLAVLMLNVWTACGKTEEASDALPETTAVQTMEEGWKTALAEELFQRYGVLPEEYEALGNGMYQVYAEVGGEILPIVVVDASTGAYHWNGEED